MNAFLFNLLCTTNPKVLEVLTADGWPNWYSMETAKQHLLEIETGYRRRVRYPILLFRKFNRKIAESYILSNPGQRTLEFFARWFMEARIDDEWAAKLTENYPLGPDYPFDKRRANGNIYIINSCFDTLRKTRH